MDLDGALRLVDLYGDRLLVERWDSGEDGWSEYKELDRDALAALLVDQYELGRTLGYEEGYARGRGALAERLQRVVVRSRRRGRRRGYTEAEMEEVLAWHRPPGGPTVYEHGYAPPRDHYTG